MAPGQWFSSAYAQAVLNDRPTFYFRLNEASGATVTDISGRGINGSYTAASYGQAGLLVGDTDTSVDFNGSTAFAKVLDQAALDFSSAFTLEAWVRADTAGNNTILRKDSAWAIDYNTGHFRAIVWQSAAAKVTNGANVTITGGLTFHVVGVYNGATIALYVDGAATGTPTAAVGTADATATDAYIGSTNGTTEFWDGRIDEVAVYDYALSATRIAAHHTAGV